MNGDSTRMVWQPESSGHSFLASQAVNITNTRYQLEKTWATNPSSDDLIYETGVMRMFGSYDIGTSGLVSGWAAPEETHVWNDGVEVVMKIRMQVANIAYRLRFEGTPFLNSARPSQDMTLYVNGFYAGFWRMSEARDYQFNVTLEPEQLYQRDGMALIKLVWCIPQSIRPADVNAGSDSRELGFCFRSLLIAEVA